MLNPDAVQPPQRGNLKKLQNILFVLGLATIALLLINYEKTKDEDQFQIFPESYISSTGKILKQRGDYFDFLSPPFSLKYGEVHCKDFEQNGTAKLPLPEEIVQKFDGKTMVITGYDVAIVKVNGFEEPAPMTEVYNHHYIAYLLSKEDCKKDYASPDHPFAAFNNANGGEYRTSFHGYISDNIGSFVHTPTCFQLFAHAINTKIPQGVNRQDAEPQESLANVNDQEYSGLLECPCTDRRIIDREMGTIDGMPIDIYCVGDTLNFQQNDACSIKTYKGGAHCCMDQNILLDKNQTDQRFEVESTFHYKFRFYYRDFKEGDHIDREIYIETGHFEWTVPKCKRASESCIHVNRHELTMYDTGGDQINDDFPKFFDHGKKVAKLIYANGHAHTGHISSELFNKKTGQMICHQEGRYGTGTGGLANEKDYLVGIPPCVWDEHNAPILTLDTVLISIVRYNSTYAHYGVMGPWQMRAIFVDA